MTLAQLKKGQKAVVKDFSLGENFDPALLFDQGIYEGAEVMVCNISPLGRDPIAIEVNGSKLAIRKDLASMINIDLIDE